MSAPTAGHSTQGRALTAPTRTWWGNAVVYQVYVRSFADGTGDGVGDLVGLRSRLPYIAALGVDAIWLNPCYPSPQRYGGYDVSDYFTIDPEYGTLEDFRALVSQADSYGIRVLMDMVPNHCSTKHQWFRGAVAGGRGAPERERFWFSDGRGKDGGQPPNDWKGIFGGPAWTRVAEPDGRPGQWYLGVFTPQQPDFNWHSGDVVAYFDRVLATWFDRGVSGFRVDAVTVLGSEGGLPDAIDTVPFGRADSYFEHHPHGSEVWRHWRGVVDDYNRDNPGREVFLIAQVWTPPDGVIFRNYVGHDAFHQGFAFNLTLCNWRAADWAQAIQTTLEATVERGIPPAWTLNNHDVQRTVTRYGRADARRHRPPEVAGLADSETPVDVEVGRRRARAAALAMLALPGSAYLYAGEELGLPEVTDLPHSACQDPIVTFTDGAYPGRDGCRVPLPWTVSSRAGHGFTAEAADPWLPQPVWWGQRSAEALEGDPTSTLHLYRDAIAARRRIDAFTRDTTQLVDVGEDAVAFTRGEALVVLNMASRRLSLPAELIGDRRLVLSSDPHHNQRDRTEVPADACVWLSA